MVARKPLQYFPDDYNGSLSTSGVEGELKKEIEQWNIDYYELLEFRKNPTLGRMKCSKCLLSGFFDDPLFVGIERVFARIVSNICNKDNDELDFTAYPFKVMNFFKCPFESINDDHNNSKPEEEQEKTKYLFKRENLFTLQRIAFAIEQAIATLHFMKLLKIMK